MFETFKLGNRDFKELKTFTVPFKNNKEINIYFEVF